MIYGHKSYYHSTIGLFLLNFEFKNCLKSALSLFSLNFNILSSLISLVCDLCLFGDIFYDLIIYYKLDSDLLSFNIVFGFSIEGYYLFFIIYIFLSI
jgi:hypothetical protein